LDVLWQHWLSKRCGTKLPAVGLNKTSRTHFLPLQIPGPYSMLLMWKTRYINLKSHSAFGSEFHRPWPTSMSHGYGERGKNSNIALPFTEQLVEHIPNTSSKLYESPYCPQFNSCICKHFENTLNFLSPKSFTIALYCFGFVTVQELLVLGALKRSSLLTSE
jgi:hypothetical protein